MGSGRRRKESIEIRVNPEKELEDREKEYLETESHEYKHLVNSGKVLIGSPEWAGSIQEEGLKDEVLGIKSIDLENGIYSVKVYFLSWNYSDSSLEDLPEYIVVLKKVDENYQFAPVTTVETLG